jgi:hypothetical protein
MVELILARNTRRSHPLEIPALLPSVVTPADRWEPPVRTSDVLFTPNENAYDYEVRCLEEVIAARRADPNRYAEGEDPYRILYAVYNLRNRRVFDKLVEAHRLGIPMQVLIEADQIAPDRPHNKLAAWFTEAGLTVIRSDRGATPEALEKAHLIGVDRAQALMHMKSRILRWKDPSSGELRHKLLMGPLNPGGDPLKNDEHLNIFTEPSLVERFARRYLEVRAHQQAVNTWDEESPLNVLFTPHTPESKSPTDQLFRWIDAENELIVMTIFCIRNLSTRADRETLVDKLKQAKQRGAKVLVITDMRKSDGKTLVFDAEGRPKRNERGELIREGVEMYGEEAGDDPTDEKLVEAGIPVIEVVNRASQHSAMHERFTLFGLTNMRVLASEGNYTTAAMGSRGSRPRNQESYVFIESARYDDNYTGRAFLGRALQLLRKYDAQFEESAEEIIRDLQSLPAWPKLKLDPFSLVRVSPGEKIDLVLGDPVGTTVELPSADRIGSLRSRPSRRMIELPFGTVLGYRTKDARTGELGEMQRVLIADAPDHPAPELS